MALATSYIKKLRSESSLRKAWKTVRENGLSSKSLDTRNSIKDFEKKDYRNIRKISDSIRTNTFIFRASRGITIPRPGKEPRPIVMAPVENRIVQRAILDVLQSIPDLFQYVNTPTSFGGIKGRSVSAAITSLITAYKDGAKYYIRSDIKEYFRNIPKQDVLATIDSIVRDKDFMRMLDSATTVELSNISSIKYSHLFPTHEIGVAQGCCLSPLLGNILLHEFDHQLNGRGITCLRYIDDFIVLGSSPSYVKKAFLQGLELLKKKGLTAHEPSATSSKCQQGYLDNGVDFLGCTVTPNNVRPNRLSLLKFKTEVKKIVSDNLIPRDHSYSDRSLRSMLHKLHHYLEGWGNQYNFCDDKKLFMNLDKWLNDQLREAMIRFNREYQKCINKNILCQAVLGIHCVSAGK